MMKFTKLMTLMKELDLQEFLIIKIFYIKQKINQNLKYLKSKENMKIKINLFMMKLLKLSKEKIIYKYLKIY